MITMSLAKSNDIKRIVTIIDCFLFYFVTFSKRDFEMCEMWAADNIKRLSLNHNLLSYKMN